MSSGTETMAMTAAGSRPVTPSAELARPKTPSDDITRPKTPAVPDVGSSSKNSDKNQNSGVLEVKKKK